ncbi:MAG: hypothetical protein NZL85_06075 [Fimbriimonadales bacterium]|nr:hypothetical protein [Fimbriimonadales bacterium]
MRTTGLILTGLLVVADAPAQGQVGSNGGVLGLILLYLALAAVGLVGLILRREGAQAHIRAIREQGQAVFWRGFGTGFIMLILFLAFVALGESIKEARGEAAATPARLMAAAVALSYLVIALFGFGSVAVVVGDSAAQLFGWRDLSAGWCILLGSAIMVLVVWIPLFGWVLGVYWLSLCVGGLWRYAAAGEQREVESP